MNFKIAQAENEEDWDFFFDLSFETLKILRKSWYDKLVSDNPNGLEEELLAAHRKEMEEFSDFKDPKTRVFIATSDGGQRCGYLWMGERNSEDAWDFQKPQWIYDIVVDPKFQGNGLGKMLMVKAEEFAREMNRDIGLFVHEDNTSAINLYKKENYFIKCIPMSKKISEEVSQKTIEGYSIRELNGKDISMIRELGLFSYKEMVKISKDVPEAQVATKYDEYYEKINNSEKNYSTFVTETSEGDIVGFVTVEVASFNDKVGVIHDSAIDETHKKAEHTEVLIAQAESWSKSNDLSVLYYLLNTNDVISQESLQSLGFGVPGYFMEKDLFRDLPV